MRFPTRTLSRLLPISLAVLVMGAAGADDKGAAGRKPNIIFIVADDLGYGDIGVFYQNARAAKGEPAELTPHLDAMAAQGIQLRDHYTAAPMCAPARATLLSGVGPGQSTVRDNQFDKALDDNHTLATVLKAAGYTTAVIGEWGLQGGKESPDDDEGSRNRSSYNPTTWPAYPTKRGFDYFFGYVRHQDGHEHYPREALHDGHKQVWDLDKQITPFLAGCYTADLFTARAKKWIVDQLAAEKKKPFFLYLAYDTPHAVLEYPPMAYPSGGGMTGGLQWLGQPGNMINTATGEPDSYCYPEYAKAVYTGRGFGRKVKSPAEIMERPWPVVCKRYASGVRRLDDCVGDLLQLLRDLRIDDNTMVVFTSDNGPGTESSLAGGDAMPNFFHSFGPFDGIKRDCLEGGIREGAIVRWPGQIPAGRVDVTPSQFQDWMPTLADVAGIPAPARTDGVSLLPTLTGGSGQKTSTVYSEYADDAKMPNFPEFDPSHRNRARGQMQMLRIGDFVGVRYNIKSAADDFEIYDIAHDPQEVTNLAASKPDLEKKMKDSVLQGRRPDPDAPRPYDDEFVPPSAPMATVPGVQWQSCKVGSTWLPKMDALPVAASGTALQPGGLMPEANDTAMLYTGYLQVPADGDYTFSLTTKSKALLRIHGATVIDEDYGFNGGTREGEIKLRAGLHFFRLYFLPGPTPTLDLKWSVNGAADVEIPAEVFCRPQ